MSDPEQLKKNLIAWAKEMSTLDLHEELTRAYQALKNRTYVSHEAAVDRHQILQDEMKSRETDFCGWAQGKFKWEGDK